MKKENVIQNITNEKKNPKYVFFSSHWHFLSMCLCENVNKIIFFGGYFSTFKKQEKKT